ncbi:MAG: PAS domain-containing protein [Deltaproteobacteria bacterium]|nr:PAS domain-containing protein [Deltaproteobacteria bacterium]
MNRPQVKEELLSAARPFLEVRKIQKLDEEFEKGGIRMKIATLGERVKVSEEKYQALFEGSPDGVVVCRPGGGRILECNRQTEHLLLKMRHQLRKMSLVDLFPKRSKKTLKDGLEKIMLGPVDFKDLCIPLEKGKTRTLSMTASGIRHEGEKAVLCIFKDVTEKRLLENQIRQTEKMSLLGQFTAGAAHEINNPLAIISSHTQYLLENVLNKKIRKKEMNEIRETLNLLYREAHFCGGIIKNLLAYTHVNGVVRKPVDLTTVVNHSIKMVERQLKLSNITVEKRFTETIPHVLSDDNLLQQVLMNLIWNAQAAMPKGGKLRVEVRTDQKGSVEVIVSDTGLGIHSKNLDKIYTPFFTTKEIGKGTGLGLWVVKSILDDHKAAIDVKSRVGKGTVFTIKFPAAS